MDALPLTMTQERVQKVVFVRHGVARHNLLDPVTGHPPNLESPDMWDPPLVYQGKQQALEAGERLKVWWQTTQLGEEVELVVTSPLTRCIQTTMYGFLPGDFYTRQNNPREPTIYCSELVREAYGMHYPDRRRDKSLLQKHWPIVEFDPEMLETDEAWQPRSRETIDGLQNRISSFLQTLVVREETNIVVVTHGVWIETCLNTYCPDALDGGQRRVHNCNIFVGDLVSELGVFERLQNAHQIH